MRSYRSRRGTKPFDLSIAPLIRVTHVRVRSDVAVLLVTTHHVVCDGWSIGLLAREMGEFCARPCRQARRPTLPDLPITYGDYAAWQRELVASDGLAPEIAYWTRALDGLEYLRAADRFPAQFRSRVVRCDPIPYCWTGL